MKRSLSGLIAALLCTSCLGSKEPFIVENEATLPLTNGTVLQKYTVDGDSATYVENVVLKIEEGRYYAIDGGGRFRVRPIAGTPYLLVMGKGLDSYAYGLIGYDAEDSIYVALDFMSSNLDEYVASRPDEAPKNTRKDAFTTYFQNRADLERMIVAMAEQDYFNNVTVYRPVRATAERQTQPRISQSQQGTQQQPEQPLTPGEAVVGGLIGLGILALLFGDSGDSSAADTGSEPNGEWKGTFWCKTEFLDPDPVNKPTRCYVENGSSWEMHWLHPCYGVEGWCTP